MSTAAADAPKRPQRIVSTNACTDQMLLYLVEPERIASMTWLSWDAGATPPRFAPALARIKQNHGLAEQVLMLEPDLVVSGSFSARFTNDLLTRMKKNVVVFDPDESFDDMYRTVRKMGAAVGEPERAERLIAAFRARFERLKAAVPPGPRPLYADIDANLYTPGLDTLAQTVISAAGFRTLGEEIGFSGYQAVPIERLIRYHPDVIEANGGRARVGAPTSMAVEALNHPLLRKMAREAKAVIDIPARYLACTTPETLDMVEELVNLRRAMAGLPAIHTGEGS